MPQNESLLDFVDTILGPEEERKPRIVSPSIMGDPSLGGNREPLPTDISFTEEGRQPFSDMATLQVDKLRAPVLDFTPSRQAKSYIDKVREAEQMYDLPQNLLARVIEAESSYNPAAHSSKGAVGIAQIMPGSHPDVDPTDPEASIDYAGKYLRSLYNDLGDWKKAVAAYNWGPERVKKYGLERAPVETRGYLSRIFGPGEVQAAEAEPQPQKGASIFDFVDTTLENNPPATIGRVAGAFPTGLKEGLAKTYSGMAAHQQAIFDPEEVAKNNPQFGMSLLSPDEQEAVLSGVRLAGTPDAFIGLLTDALRKKKASNLETLRAGATMPELQPAPEYQGKTSGYAEDVARAFGGTLLPMSLGAISPILSGMAMHFQIVGDKMDTYVAQGVPFDTAFKAATADAAAQGILESTGTGQELRFLKRLGDKLKSGGALKKVGAFLLSIAQVGGMEGAEEFVQQFPDEIADIYVKHSDKSAAEIAKIAWDNREEIRRNAAQAFAVGAGVGAIFPFVGGGMAAMSRTKQALAKQPQDVQSGQKTREDILENVRTNLARGMDDKGVPVDVDLVKSMAMSPMAQKLGLVDDLNKIIIDHIAGKPMVADLGDVISVAGGTDAESLRGGERRPGVEGGLRQGGEEAGRDLVLEEVPQAREQLRQAGQVADFLTSEEGLYAQAWEQLAMRRQADEMAAAEMAGVPGRREKEQEALEKAWTKHVEPLAKAQKEYEARIKQIEEQSEKIAKELATRKAEEEVWKFQHRPHKEEGWRAPEVVGKEAASDLDMISRLLEQSGRPAEFAAKALSKKYFLDLASKMGIDLQGSRTRREMADRVVNALRTRAQQPHPEMAGEIEKGLREGLPTQPAQQISRTLGELVDNALKTAAGSRPVMVPGIGTKMGEIVEGAAKAPAPSEARKQIPELKLNDRMAASQVKETTIVNDKTFGQVEDMIMRGDPGLGGELESIHAEHGREQFMDIFNDAKIGSRIYKKLRDSGVDKKEAMSQAQGILNNYTKVYNSVIKKTPAEAVTPAPPAEGAAAPPPAPSPGEAAAPISTSAEKAGPTEKEGPAAVPYKKGRGRKGAAAGQLRLFEPQTDYQANHEEGVVSQGGEDELQAAIDDAVEALDKMQKKAKSSETTARKKRAKRTVQVQTPGEIAAAQSRKKVELMEREIQYWHELQGGVEEMKALARAGHVKFVGEKIVGSIPKQCAKIASMFQNFRSAKCEFFHAIFTDADGAILDNQCWSSGVVSSVNLGDGNAVQYAHQIWQEAKRLGAIKVHFFHNHPGGNPEPSTGDANFFRFMKSVLGDMTGNWVSIDHGKFAYISDTDARTPSGDPGWIWETGTYEAKEKIRGDLDETAIIDNPQAVANYASTVLTAYNLFRQGEKSLAIVVNNMNALRGFSVIDNNELNTPLKQRKALTEAINERAGSKAFLITNNQGVIDATLSQSAIGDYLVDLHNFGSGVSYRCTGDEKINEKFTRRASAMDFITEQEQTLPPERFERKLRSYTPEHTPEAERIFDSQMDAVEKRHGVQHVKRTTAASRAAADAEGMEQDNPYRKAPAYKLVTLEREVQVIRPSKKHAIPKEIRQFVVSLPGKIASKIKDGRTDIRLATPEEARKYTANAERAADYMKLYEQARVLQAAKLMRDTADSGKLTGLVVLTMNQGCGRSATIVERVNMGLLPLTTRLEACYGGTCWVNFTQPVMAMQAAMMDVREMKLPKPGTIEKFVAKNKDKLLASAPGFIREGYSGDSSHLIAGGDAAELMEALKKNGVNMPVVFISASYAPVTDAQYRELAKYKNAVVHFTNSGWFHKNEILIRMGEFLAARNAGVRSALRIITNNSKLNGVEMANEEFLLGLMEKYGLKQEEVLQTPYHNDSKPRTSPEWRSEPDPRFLNECCKNKQCNICPARCLTGVTSFIKGDIDYSGKTTKYSAKMGGVPRPGTPEYRGKDWSRVTDFVSLDDARQIFKGAEVSIAPEGGLHVVTTKGHKVNIIGVKQIAPDEAAIKIGYGREAEGDTIAGKYHEGVISLARYISDKWDLAHESFHWMEDIGLVKPFESKLLRNKIQALAKDGKWETLNAKDIGGMEDRAEYIAQQLKRRSETGALGRMVNRIRDFVDGLINIFHRTTEGVIRDIESGKILEREGEGPTGVGVQYSEIAPKWYSQMEKFLSEKMPGSGKAGQLAKDIENWAAKGNFKKDELEWSGLTGWLLEQGDRKVTKKEVLDFLTANNVKVEEVVKRNVEMFEDQFDELPEVEYWEYNDDRKEYYYRDQYTERAWTITEEAQEYEKGEVADVTYVVNTVDTAGRTWFIGREGDLDAAWQRAIDDHRDYARDQQMEEYKDSEKAPQYEEYQEPGGREYAELLLTLPRKKIVGKEIVDVPQLDWEDITDTREMLDPKLQNLVAWDESPGSWGKFYIRETIEPGEQGEEGPLWWTSKYHVAFKSTTGEWSNLTDRRSSSFDVGTYDTLPEAKDAAQGYYKQIKEKGGGVLEAVDHPEITYKSSHWKEPNVLAHVRFNTRYGPSGESVLFLEEIQSDWHQEGRKKGYKGEGHLTEDDQQELAGLEEMASRLREERRVLEEKQVKTGSLNQSEAAMLQAKSVRLNMIGNRMRDIRDKEGTTPQAPWKRAQDWSMLAMRRMIRWAAEKGYDRIAWTPGFMQVARYETHLRKNVDEIIIHREGVTFNLEARKSGREVAHFYALTKEKLTEHVGKELASKAIAQLGEKPGPNKEWYAGYIEGYKATHWMESEEEARKAAEERDKGRHGVEIRSQMREAFPAPVRFKGHDLTIGGEGMKGFYDRMLPSEVGKFVKKFGSRVEPIDFEGDRTRFQILDEEGRSFGVYKTREAAEGLLEEYEKKAGPLRIVEWDKKTGRPVEEGGTGPIRVWSIPITEKMREAAIGQGMPLFKRRPGPVAMRKSLLAAGQHQHHTLPVMEGRDTAAQIRTLDWHLNNLWDGGWKTISDKDAIEHMKLHGERRRKLPPLFKLVNQKAYQQAMLDQLYGEARATEIEREFGADADETIRAKSKLGTLQETIGDLLKDKDFVSERYDSNWIRAILSTPDFYFKKDPAAGAVLDAWLNHPDNKYHIMNHLLNNGTEVSDATPMVKLEKSDKAEYKKLKDVLLEMDRNREPVTADELREKGFSDLAVHAFESRRKIFDRGFELLFSDMRAMIKDAEDNGWELPKVVVIDEDGERVKVDLRVAMAEMQKIKNTYEPRMRKAGMWRVIAKKEGGTQELHLTDSRIRAKWLVRDLKKQGYQAHYEKGGRMPEDVMSVGKVAAVEQILNAALEKMESKQGTIKSLEDAGLSGKMEGKTFVVTGPFNKIQTLVFKKLGGKYYAVEEGGPRAWRFQNPTKGFEQRLIKALDAAEGSVPDTTGMFSALIAGEVADIFRARGARSSMIKRGPEKGIEVWRGYEEDPNRNVAMYAQGLAGLMAKKQAMLETVQAMSGTKDIHWRDFDDWEAYREEVKKRRLDPKKQPQLYSDVMAMVNDMSRNEEAWERFAGHVRGVAALKYLGFRLAAVPVNLSALLTSVPAAMKGYAQIGFGKALKSVAKSMGDFYTYRFGDRSKLDDNTRKVMDHIHEHGWHQAQYNKEAIDMLRSRIGSGYDNAVRLAMLGMGVSEQINRVSTIAGAAKVLMDGGMGFDEAIGKAKKVSDKAHATYSKATLPRWGRNVVGRALYVFKRFQHNYLQTMYELGAEKHEAQAALWMAISPVLLGGAAAFPLYSALKPVWDLVLSKAFDWDDPEEELYDHVEAAFGEKAGRFSRFGLPGFPEHGVSFKGSLAMNLFDLPDTWFELLGAPGAALGDLFEGTKMVLKGQPMKGAEKILPLAMGNVVKAYREATEGVTTVTGGPKYYGADRLKLDGVDAIIQALSFAPAAMQEKKQKLQSARLTTANFSERRQEILTAVKQYYLADPEDRTIDDYAKIMKKIEDYNKLVVERGWVGIIPFMTGKTIKQNLKRQFKPSAKDLRLYRRWEEREE